MTECEGKVTIHMDYWKDKVTNHQWTIPDCCAPCRKKKRENRAAGIRNVQFTPTTATLIVADETEQQHENDGADDDYMCDYSMAMSDTAMITEENNFNEYIQWTNSRVTTTNTTSTLPTRPAFSDFYSQTRMIADEFSTFSLMISNEPEIEQSDSSSSSEEERHDHMYSSTGELPQDYNRHLIRQKTREKAHISEALCEAAELEEQASAFKINVSGRARPATDPEDFKYSDGGFVLIGSKIQDDLLSSPEDAAAIINSSCDRSQNSIDYESGAEAGEMETPAAPANRPQPNIKMHILGNPTQTTMERYMLAPAAAQESQIPQPQNLTEIILPTTKAAKTAYDFQVNVTKKDDPTDYVHDAMPRLVNADTLQDIPIPQDLTDDIFATIKPPTSINCENGTQTGMIQRTMEEMRKTTGRQKHARCADSLLYTSDAADAPTRVATTSGPCRA